MLKEQPPTTDFSVVRRMLEAVEQGDMDTLRRCFAPGAVVWHNHDQAEQDIDTVIATMLAPVCAISTSRTYNDRRITTAGSLAFLQHTMTVTLQSGTQARIPSIQRVQIGADGLVTRMEEYFDSRAIEPLFAGLR